MVTSEVHQYTLHNRNNLSNISCILKAIEHPIFSTSLLKFACYSFLLAISQAAPHISLQSLSLQLDLYRCTFWKSLKRHKMQTYKTKFELSSVKFYYNKKGTDCLILILLFENIGCLIASSLQCLSLRLTLFYDLVWLWILPLSSKFRHHISILTEYTEVY